MSGRLAGRRALVIGAAPGNLGDAIARLYRAEGAQVAIAGRREEATTGLAADIGALGIAADITVEADLDHLFAQVDQVFGGIDIAVNASGWGLLVPFLQCSRDEIDRMCALQFAGPFQFFQRAVAMMSREGAAGGSLIQISSVTAQIMMDDHAAYMGTKAGFDHVMRCIAHEFGPAGIRANSLAPGGIADTPMSGGGLNLPQVAALYGREIPLGRPGVSAEVADAALWLASDESRFVTGQTIHVSGGQTLRRNPRFAEVAALFAEAD